MNEPRSSIARLAFLEERGEEVPHVNHARPHVELREYARLLGVPLDQAGIIEDDLTTPHLDEKGRQAMECRTDGRRKRVARLAISDVGPSHGQAHLSAHDRVELRQCCVGLSATLEVGERRQQNATSGQRHAGVAKRDEQGECQARTSGVSADGDLFWRDSRSEQPPIRRDRILDRGWEDVLRCEPIVREHDRCARAEGDPLCEAPVRSGGAQAVTAPVEEEDDSRGRYAVRLDLVGRNSAGNDARDGRFRSSGNRSHHATKSARMSSGVVRSPHPACIDRNPAMIDSRSRKGMHCSNEKTGQGYQALERCDPSVGLRKETLSGTAPLA